MKNDRKSAPNSALRDARKARGWSQPQLAELLGTTSVNISRWETGATSPASYLRQRLYEVFGKTATELGLGPPPNDFRVITLSGTRNLYFTGREDLLTLLHARLTSAKTAALTQPQALYGLGGIGKTQTAIEYAYRYEQHYTHIFWIRAATRDLLTSDFVSLAHLLDLAEKDTKEQAQVIAAVKRWLANNQGWLLILDNADDLPLAYEFLPNKRNGYILLTTRAQAAGTIAANIEVDSLSMRDGTLLLLRLSKVLGEHVSLDHVPTAYRDAAERIVKEMDGLPLAIVQAGTYIEETGCSLTDYLDLYATHRKALLARRSKLLLDYPDTVYTTWSLSFRDVERQNSTAADVLRICAFLAPDAIPEEFFTRGAAAPDTPHGAVDAFTLNEVLEVLRRYSLVRRNSSTHMLTIHRLVQAVLRENMSQETQRTWAERTVLLVNAAFPEGDYGAGTNHQYYLQYYLPHIQLCATLIKQYHLYLPEAAHLLYQTGAFLYACGLYAQSESLHRQALFIREQIDGMNDPATADILNYLGMLSRVRGDYEQAEKLHLQALSIREKTLGPEHPKIAVSLNNLSVLYRNQGRYELAEQFLEQALIIRKQAFGSEHRSTLITIINLGKLYLEQKNYQRAEQLLSQALPAFERAVNIGHPLIAQNLHLLGKLSYEQGSYEQAEMMWKRGIEIIEKAFGKEHPSIAESFNGLARLYFIQGHYVEAHSLCEMALRIAENTFGTDHPDTTAYRKHLAEIVSKKAEE